MYKQKLYMLLKALEVKHAKELMEKPSPYIVQVGLKIAEAAKLGAPFVKLKEQFIPAPQCPNGQHELIEAPKPYWGKCEHCNEKFALVSETVIKKLGINIVERSIIKH